MTQPKLIHGLTRPDLWTTLIELPSVVGVGRCEQSIREIDRFRCLRVHGTPCCRHCTVLATLFEADVVDVESRQQSASASERRRSTRRPTTESPSSAVDRTSNYQRRPRLHSVETQVQLFERAFRPRRSRPTAARPDGPRSRTRRCIRGTDGCVTRICGRSPVG